MDLFERNKKQWIEVYLYGKKIPVNRGMALGRQMAEGLEKGEMTGELALDLAMAKLPKFEVMDKEFRAELQDAKRTIKILAKPDSMRKDMSGFYEFKTGQTPWSQRKADESGQITFYATAMYLVKRRIPSDIELVWVPTEKENPEALDSKLTATGEIRRYRTERSIHDILKMMIRMRSAWHGIERLTERELL